LLAGPALLNRLVESSPQGIQPGSYSRKGKTCFFNLFLSVPATRLAWSICIICGQKTLFFFGLRAWPETGSRGCQMRPGFTMKERLPKFCWPMTGFLPAGPESISAICILWSGPGKTFWIWASPGKDIVLVEFTECGSIHDVLNTRDYVLSREDIRSLLVVTSDYHARRTLWSFRHVFREKDIRIGVNPAEFDNDGSRLNNLPWPWKWPSICSAGLGMACTYILKFTFRVKRPNRSPHLMLINGPSLQVVFTCL